MKNSLNKQISFRLKLLVLWKIPENLTGIIENLYRAKFWFLNGKLHRTNGPACEYFDGSKAWYLNGIYYSKENWTKKIQKLNEKSIK